MPSQEHWHSPSSLSDQELLRMQQDAQRRVRRMQQQASDAMRGTVPQRISPAPHPPRPEHTSPPEPLPPSRNTAAPVRSPAVSLLEPLRMLLQDEDRLLILLLLLLLGSEKTDPALLLALAYLIM